MDQATKDRIKYQILDKMEDVLVDGTLYSGIAESRFNRECLQWFDPPVLIPVAALRPGYTGPWPVQPKPLYTKAQLLSICREFGCKVSKGKVGKWTASGYQLCQPATVIYWPSSGRPVV